MAEKKPEEEIVNQRVIKVNKFSAPIEKHIKLKRGYSYPVAMYMDVVDRQGPDNFDGTINRVYVLKPDGRFNIRTEDGKTIVTKIDKRKDSQKLRGQIINTAKGDVNLEDHYHDRMTLLRHFWSYVDEYLDKLRTKEQKGEL